MGIFSSIFIKKQRKEEQDICDYRRIIDEINQSSQPDLDQELEQAYAISKMNSTSNLDISVENVGHQNEERKNANTKISEIDIIDKREIFNTLIDEKKKEDFKIHLAKLIIDKNYNEVKDLINLGVEINYKIESLSPLMYAVTTNDISIVKLLVENGAQVNIRYTNGTNIPNSALSYAILSYPKYGRMDIVTYLLDNGAEYNSWDVVSINKNNTLVSLFSEYKNNYVNILQKTQINDSIINNYKSMPKKVLYNVYIDAHIKAELIKRGIFDPKEEKKY